MNKVLEDLGYTKNPTFKEVFSAEMSKRVVNDYWKKLIKERNLGLFSISVSIKDVLRTLFLADKKLKPKQGIYLLGLFMLARDENGMRQLRTIIAKRSHDRTWYRIAKDMQQASDRIEHTSIKYREAHVQIGKRFAKATKFFMPEKLAVQIIGINGVEWSELRKDELGDFDITITGGSTQKANDERKSQKQNEAVSLILKDQALKSRVNQDWLIESILRGAGYSDEEIKVAIDVNNSGDQEIMSEAAEAIEMIINGKQPKINRSATTGFMQKIIDYAAEKNDSIPFKIYDALVGYALKHEAIAEENARKKKKSVLASLNPKAPAADMPPTSDMPGMPTTIPTPTPGPTVPPVAPSM
jgi:hypothetical protein